MRYKEIAGTSRAEEMIKLLEEAGVATEQSPADVDHGHSRAPLNVESGVEQLDEGRRFVRVNNRDVIAIDTPHHDGQQEHAHLPNGKVVNKDGTPSHGKEPFRVTRDEAVALRGQDFAIAKTRLVESAGGAVRIEVSPEVLELLVRLQLWLD